MLIWRVLRVAECASAGSTHPSCPPNLRGRKFADGKPITRTSGKVAWPFTHQLDGTSPATRSRSRLNGSVALAEKRAEQSCSLT